MIVEVEAVGRAAGSGPSADGEVEEEEEPGPQKMSLGGCRKEKALVEPS